MIKAIMNFIIYINVFIDKIAITWLSSTGEKHTRIHFFCLCFHPGQSLNTFDNYL